uniref:Uncharacterized protein n=1 Tax=Anopheles melas TaxID=34690 RepID=A0A182TH37_9DIPT
MMENKIVFLLFLGALLGASRAEALPDESFLITSVNKQNLLKALLQQESTSSNIGLRGSGQKDEDGYHYDRPQDPLCLLSDGPHCQQTKPDNGYLPPCAPGSQGPNCQPTAPICPQGGNPPHCCTNGGNGPNCVLPEVPPIPPIIVHPGHTGAPIVQVQTFVYGACTNGGSGPYCCTNGANTPDCVLTTTNEATVATANETTTSTANHNETSSTANDETSAATDHYKASTATNDETSATANHDSPKTSTYYDSSEASTYYNSS